MKSSVLVLAVLVLMVFSSKINAGNVNHTVKGQIINSTNNNPVIGAGIILEDSAVLVGTITDEDGSFTLLNVSEGIHYIQVRQEGFDDKMIKVDVANNDEVTLNVVLKKTENEPFTSVKDDSESSNRSLFQLFINPQLNFNLLKSMFINF